MENIILIRESQIELPKIEQPLIAPKTIEGGTDANDVSQTQTTGIVYPLIKISNIVINIQDLRFFTLRSTGIVPECHFSFVDTMNILRTLDKLDKNTLVQVQILPDDDGIAKKINMLFQIATLSTNNDMINVSCVYKMNGLYDTRLESFGQTTTYDMCDKISAKLQMGFASDVQSTNDNRYIYLSCNNYIQAMQREMMWGGETYVIPDVWIDFHNNIVLQNLYDAYTKKQENISFNASIGPTQSMTQTPNVVKMDTLSNHTSMRNTSLYVETFTKLNGNGVSFDRGDNRIIDTFNFDTREIDQTQIVDSDFEQSNTYKYFYVGEKYDAYDFQLRKQCNELFRQKMNGNTICVTLRQPALDIERGMRVNFAWFEHNSIINNTKFIESEQQNVDNQEVDGEKYNAQYSGQYLITGITIDFSNNGSETTWSYKINMTKPDVAINK